MARINGMLSSDMTVVFAALVDTHRTIDQNYRGSKIQAVTHIAQCGLSRCCRFHYGKLITNYRHFSATSRGRRSEYFFDALLDVVFAERRVLNSPSDVDAPREDHTGSVA